jgi:hypothetical protein
MKKIFILFCLTCLCTVYLHAQIGLKAGLNFANVTNASSINASNKSGFHVGLFLAPSSKKIFGYRTELLFSKQGYNFKTGTNTSSVSLNYLLLPQLTTISITKYFQLQLGMQMAWLLNAKADSIGTSSGDNSYGKIIDYYNRFDYGIAGGVEIHPYKGLLIGGRYTMSLGDLYKQPDLNQASSDTGNSHFKNNAVQLFVGWRFGK